ncbi:MAG TPA: hypothetical protein V6C72_07370, partial [Chroococcales cyanobacterium]
SDNGPSEPICSPPLAAKPYLRVFGGDVDTGVGVGTAPSACTINTNSSIYAWNQGSAGGYAGSGTQFGAEAYAIITGTATSGTGFASALGNTRSSGSASPPAGLTLANTTGTFGGGFGSAPSCADYTQGLTPTMPGGGAVGSTTLSLGQHVIQYATGNVYIDGNIIYTSTGWTDASKIPTYKLVVLGGNIYIDKSVTELDGLYVAEPDSAGQGGEIFTCASGHASIPAGQLFSSCNQQLKIYGSFVAKQVHFQRTMGNNGSDYQSTTTEVPSNSHAAEVFVYSPEMWMAQPPSPLNKHYDAITSLPPIL